MDELLGGVGTLSSVLSSFSEAKPIVSTTDAGGLTVMMPVLSLNGEGPMTPKMPACTSWMMETEEPFSRNGKPAKLVLVKQCINGHVSFFTNKAFDSYVISRQALETSWAARGRPSTELFLHPDDAEIVCAFVGQLWKDLSTTYQRPIASAAITLPGMVLEEKNCMRDLPCPVRLWVSSPFCCYAQCNGRVQLVVSRTSEGQTSHVVFCFGAAQVNGPPGLRSIEDSACPPILPAQISIPTFTFSSSFPVQPPAQELPCGSARASKLVVPLPPPSQTNGAICPPPIEADTLLTNYDGFWDSVTFLASDGLDELVFSSEV